MNNLKKYTAPTAKEIMIGMTSMCCNSTLSVSDTPATPNNAVMSKQGDLIFDDEEEMTGNW